VLGWEVAKMYECIYTDKCPDAEFCFLKYHRLWSETCEKRASFLTKELWDYDQGGENNEHFESVEM